MFEIVENNFIKDGTVKYKDEWDNSIIIRANKTGENFTLIAKVNDKKFVEKFKFPYEEKGLNIQYTNGEKIKTEEEIILYEIASIAERWINIGKNVYALFSDNLSKFANWISNEDYSEITIVEKILNKLYIFEEMQPLVDTYIKLANC